MFHWPSDLLAVALSFSLSVAGVAGKLPGGTPDSCPIHDEETSLPSVVEGVLEGGAGMQAGEQGQDPWQRPQP